MKTVCSIFLILLFTLNIVVAQEGPVVPCVGCENLSAAPFPETGLWYNPDQSPGSGLNFEIQNGVLAGFFYGYTAEGKPEWQLVSGDLIRSEKEGVLWELETTLSRADGGSCISCEFTPPQITQGATIRLEFMQRNYLRISIGGVFDQFFVPFTYGSAAKAYFDGQTPYLFPSNIETELPIFIIIIKSDINQHSTWATTISEREKEEIIFVEGKKTIRYTYVTRFSQGTPATAVSLIITCAVDALEANPVCEVDSLFDNKVYSMPIGNFGDSRFIAEAEDGSVIEGFRVDYD